MIHSQHPFPFPEASPESLGIPSGTLRKLIDFCSTLDQAHALVVMRHGKVAAACEWAPYRMDLPHEMFSLSKSFVSVAVGLAQSEGLLHLTDKVADFFPEYVTAVTAPEMRRVTLKNLLTMSSGRDRCGFSFVDFDKGDWLQKLFEAAVAYEPGTHFVYDSSATFLLAAVIRKVTGLNVADYLQPRLFEPLGIAKPQWDCNPQGINIGGWGLWLSVLDVARFADLLLHHGCFNGKQLVPRAYLDEATAFQVDNSVNTPPDWRVGYGYQFWRCRCNGFRCDGAGGQYAVVYQKNGLTLSFVSGLSDMQRFLTGVQELLLPQLADQPLPENREDAEALAAEIGALAVPLPEFLKTPAVPARDMSGSYLVAENPWGIQKFSLQYANDDCELEVDGVRIRAGFGQYHYAQAALPDNVPHTVAARASWSTPDTLMIYALCLQTTARFTYEIRFEGEHAVMRRTTPVTFYARHANIVCHGLRQSGVSAAE